MLSTKKEPVSIEAPEVMSSSDLINNEVTNNAGENLGRLEKLMIHLGTGRVMYAVISYGSLLTSRKYVAVPWPALSFSHHDKRFLLNATKERLKEAPSFESERWPEQAKPAWINSTYSYYGYKAPSMAMPQNTTYQGLPVSSLINATVLDSQGEIVGKLKDLFVDLGNDSVVFAAISTGSFLGIDNRYYALPPKLLSVREDRLVLGVTKAKLEKGPSFEKDKWPDISSDGFMNQLTGYYERSEAETRAVGSAK